MYATKTISTGEGGILVSRHDELIEYARAYRNYGKPDHGSQGLSLRMSEFTAAIGLVQLDRLEEIVAWKNAALATISTRFSPHRVELPDGMVSGLYKYIVFEPIARSTGRVYDEPCHRILGDSVDAAEHGLGRGEPLVRPALLPRPRAADDERLGGAQGGGLKVLVTGGAGFIGSHVVDKLLDAGHEPRIFDLRPSPHHSPARSSTSSGDVTDREALRGAARRLRRDHPPGRGRRRRRRRHGPGPGRAVQRPGDRSRCSRPRATQGVQRVVYGSTTWVYSDCDPDRVDEETPLQAPSHLYTATKLAGELYCKSYSELYDVDYTILRFGIPYGPRARDATVMAAFVGQGRARRAADRGRRRQPVAPLRLRRGPRRGRRRGARARGREPRLQPRRRRGGDDPRDRRGGARPGRRHRDRPHPGPQRRLRRQGGVERARRRGARLDRRAPRSPRGLRPATSSGAAPAQAARDGSSSSPPTSARATTCPARAIARDLAAEQPGVRVEVVDGLQAMGRLLTLVVRDGSWLSFNWLPWLFELQYFLLRPVPAHPLARRCDWAACSARAAASADDP